MSVDLTRADPSAGTETPTEPAKTSTHRPRASNAVTCAGCGEWWTGVSAAHCGACHHTFAGVSLFDRHREHYGERGRCLDPAEIKKGSPIVFRDGMWRGPEMTEEQKAKRFAGK